MRLILSLMNALTPNLFQDCGAPVKYIFHDQHLSTCTMTSFRNSEESPNEPEDPQGIQSKNTASGAIALDVQDGNEGTDGRKTPGEGGLRLSWMEPFMIPIGTASHESSLLMRSNSFDGVVRPHAKRPDQATKPCVLRSNLEEKGVEESLSAQRLQRNRSPISLRLDERDGTMRDGLVRREEDSRDAKRGKEDAGIVDRLQVVGDPLVQESEDGRKTPDEGGVVLHSPQEHTKTSNTVQPKQLRESGVVRPSPRLPQGYVPHVPAGEERLGLLEAPRDIDSVDSTECLQGALEMNGDTYEEQDAMNSTNGHDVIVYGRDGCGICASFKADCKVEGIKYRMINCDDEKGGKEMWAKVRRSEWFKSSDGSVGLPVVDAFGHVLMQPSIDEVMHAKHNPAYEELDVMSLDERVLIIQKQKKDVELSLRNGDRGENPRSPVSRCTMKPESIEKSSSFESYSPLSVTCRLGPHSLSGEGAARNSRGNEGLSKDELDSLQGRVFPTLDNLIESPKGLCMPRSDRN